MSNTISKDKLIEWLDVEIDLSSGNDPVHKADRWAFNHVKRAIVRGKFDAPGWISVEDQLPDRDDDYLVRHKAGHLEVAQYDLGRWLLHGEDGFLLPLTDKVTHWMSLPEPPKEAERG